MNPNILSNKLKALRKKLGLTQTQFAEEIVAAGLLKHCTKQYISNLENNKLQNFKFFVSVMQHFKEDLNEIFNVLNKF
jgi:transcriptional regulator with XRE-family HTH domain